MSGAERVPSTELLSRQSDRRSISGNWLRPLSGDWPSAVCRALEWEPAVVRVVVAEARGSTPREPGTCMLVGLERVQGTIGGGHLEWEAVQFAREFVGRSRMQSAGCALRLVLASQLGQCCGGVVELWLERFTRADLPLLRSAAQVVKSGVPVLMASALSDGRINRRVVRAGTPAFLPPALRSVAEGLLRADAPHRVLLSRAASGRAAGRGGDEEEGGMLLERLDAASSSLWLYGAGHVGQALVRVLAELPIVVTWIDSRADLFPRGLPENVRPVPSQAPVRLAASAPPGVRHLVMTHDHGVDYDLCRAILQNSDFCWLGLIGSASKGARFRSRLRRDGISEETLRRLVCPIGVEGVIGKAPGIIAISVAAQILRTLSDVSQMAEAPEVEHPSKPAGSLSLQRRLASSSVQTPPASWEASGSAAAGCQTDGCETCVSSRGIHA